MKALSRLFAFGTISFYLLSPAAIIFAATPPTCQLKLNTSSINVGGSVTLTWSSTNAVGGAITNVGNVGPSGSANLLPSSAARTTYLGAFTGPGGTANCSATVQVGSGGGSTAGAGIANPTVQDASANGTQSPTLQNGSSGTQSPTLQTASANGTQNATLGSTNSTGTVAPTAAPASTGAVSSAVPSGLVPCGYNPFSPGQDSSGNPIAGGNASNTSTGCQACNLAQLVQNLITFLIGISIPIAAAIFAWAGVLYFTSAGDHHKLEQAKALFKSAFVGFLIVVSAWLVINTVLHAIFSQGAYANSSWFSIQCNAGGSRPNNTNIGGILSSVLGTTPIIAPQVNTNGDPTGGGGSIGNQLQARNDALTALFNACDSGDQASCTAYQSVSNTGVGLSPQATAQLATNCAANDAASCAAANEVKNLTLASTACANGGTLVAGETQNYCQNADGSISNPVVMTLSQAGGGVTSGGRGTAQCSSDNTACSVDALQAQGLTSAQANVMSCIAITESGGNPAIGCSATATPCGTFQINNGNWNAYAPAACQALSQKNNASCNLQTAAIMVKNLGYQPWTGSQNGVAWNPSATKCANNYGT